MDIQDLQQIENGGVTSALGFKAGGIHAGFRKDPGRLDLALVEADELCSCAGVFTTNIFCAAPVLLCKENLDDRGYGVARAVVINSGTANAATGELGMQAARATTEIVGDAIGAAQEDIMVCSTGVIGQLLDTAPFESAIPELHEQLSREGGADAARAIMTTDTVPKECAVSYTSAVLGGATITVGGMCKGSGMIMPNMATMLSVITTDAPVKPAALHAALSECVKTSFNCVTVDSDTSTNDTCLLFASGKAAPAAAPIEEGSEAYGEFVVALRFVMETLARKIAADGEGATKLVTVHVAGAANAEEADMAARTVANSPLTKTAIAGHDANWGRIAAALGRSGAHFAQENVDIDIMGIPVLRSGLPVEFSEEEALRRFELPEIALEANLGAGTAEATVWTCDFTHDYITINGDYRT